MSIHTQPDKHIPSDVTESGPGTYPGVEEDSQGVQEGPRRCGGAAQRETVGTGVAREGSTG